MAGVTVERIFHLPWGPPHAPAQALRATTTALPHKLNSLFFIPRFPYFPVIGIYSMSDSLPRANRGEAWLEAG